MQLIVEEFFLFEKYLQVGAGMLDKDVLVKQVCVRKSWRGCVCVKEGSADFC